MWKKTVPITAALTTLLLAGCNMNNDVPDTNETPMEDVKEDVREGANDLNPNPNVNPNVTPNVNTEVPAGTHDGTINNNELDIKEDHKIKNNGTEIIEENTVDEKIINKDANSPT